ncbi:hypothetical protein BGW38_000587 [Lunasporangiospora selenospora]|uniref:Uncharacterized protein n=1 Tax=Lunasporangiospora selenospora TaxID=979761 RepID=A0A9P6KEW0_9FUNG|nr:hypothetical protein BGW38_000587 [Lunasporangiospora selenospora]
MLDLLVGQLFLHQDRLELLPTVANILVYFYVINLTRGLVFGDSVSCLLWFLFGLVDIYRKDTAHSTASILDLTPYRVIPVHTVGFGLYILMSELVDVMLHSTEPDPIQGRYLNYVGVQKEGPVSIRSSRRSMPPTADPTSNLRFELCITEITPFTVSFCLNALSDTPSQEQPPSARDGSDPSRSDDATSTIATTTSVPALTDAVDLASIKVGSVASVLGASISRSVKSSAGSSSKQPAVSSSSSTGVTATTTTTATITPTISAKTLPTPRIISTSDIVIHVNFIPWKEVQYHFPDDQSFTVFGLTPSTDYEIEMKVHQFSSFVARVGTRAAPQPTTKTQKSRRNRKGQKSQKDTGEKSTDAAAKSKTVSVSTSTSTFNSTATVPAASVAADHSVKCSSGVNVPESTGSAHFGSSQESDRVSSTEPKSVNQLILDELRASIQYSVEAAAAIKVSIKKLKRDQSKTETLLRQELEGIGRGHAKTVVQDQKRRQKLSFMQESIKQADAAALSLREETVQVRNWTRSTTPDLESLDSAAKALEKKIQSMQSTRRTELQPLQAESQRLEAEMKRLEGERQGWIGKAVQWQENEMAPLQLRLQRLEQQQSVWKVAAAANKEKGRQANLRIAALEEEIQKKDKQHQELNKSIQEIKDTNVTLKNSVDKEIAIWEGLERESDSDEKSSYISSATQSSSPASFYGSFFSVILAIVTITVIIVIVAKRIFLARFFNGLVFWSRERRVCWICYGTLAESSVSLLKPSGT